MGKMKPARTSYLLFLASLMTGTLWAEAFQAPRLWERFTSYSWSKGANRTVPDGHGGIYAAWFNGDWVNGQQIGGLVRLDEKRGTPDPIFQPESMGLFNLFISSVAVQSDGKVVFCGSRDRCSYIARLNRDGSLDNSFRIFEVSVGARFLNLQPDGAIIATILGYQQTNIAPGTFQVVSPTLIRIRPNGIIDPNFKAPDFTSLMAPPVLDNEGRIYVGTSDTSRRAQVVRLFTDGSKDPTYPVANSFPSEWGGMPRGLAFQSDGKLVIVGDITLPRMLPANVPIADRQTNRFNAIRLDSQGRFDSTFNMVPRRLLGMGDYPRMMVMRPDDKFIVAAAGLHRFNPDGTLDPTFNRYQPTNYFNYWLSQSSDGHLFIAGDAQTGLISFDQNGNPAPEFSVQGFGATRNPQSFALMGGGRVALAGAFNRADADEQSLVAILKQVDGSLVPAQPSISQLLGADIVSPTGLAEKVEVFPSANGGAYFVGEAVRKDQFDSGAASSGFALRIREDGSADTSFQPELDLVATKPAYLTDREKKLWFFRSGAQAAVDWWFNSYNGRSPTNWLWFGRLETNGSLGANFRTAPPAGVAALFNEISAVKLDPVSSEIDQVILGEIRPLVALRSGGVLVLVCSTNGNERLVKLTDAGLINGNFSSPQVAGAALSQDYPEVFNQLTGFPTQPQNGVLQFVSTSFQAATELPDGSIMVAGSFTQLGGVAVGGLARLGADGKIKVTPLPVLATSESPFPSDQARVLGLASDENGRVYLAGTFDHVNGIPTKGIIRINGDGSWDRSFVSPLELLDYPSAIAQLRLDGETLWVGGSFRRQGERLPRPLWRLSLTTPTLLAQPVPQTAALGSSVDFDVVASGVAPLTYQWYKNGQLIANASTEKLTVPSVGSTDAGEYQVLVKNSAGSVTSATVRLIINGGAVTSVAKASAVILGGFVANITIIDGGAGYTNEPTVIISGGGGTGAVAKAFIENGRVVSIVVLSAGSGYISAPSLQISEPLVDSVSLSVRMVAAVPLGVTNSGDRILEWSPGPDGPWTAWTNGVVAPDRAERIDFDGKGRMFRVRALGGVRSAFAEANVLGGFVSSVVVKDKASGYDLPPTVTLTGGGGTGATAVAILEGDKVGWVVVVNAGIGYTTVPKVTIAPPPEALTLQPRWVPAMNAKDPRGREVRLEVGDSIQGPWRLWTNALVGPDGMVFVDLLPREISRFYRAGKGSN
jgi:uncharacterized delta-60 repeat protein